MSGSTEIDGKKTPIAVGSQTENEPPKYFVILPLATIIREDRRNREEITTFTQQHENAPAILVDFSDTVKKRRNAIPRNRPHPLCSAAVPAVVTPFLLFSAGDILEHAREAVFSRSFPESRMILRFSLSRIFTRRSSLTHFTFHFAGGSGAASLMELYTEAFDVVARIEEPGDRANEHLETVLSLYRKKTEPDVLPMISESLTLIRSLRDPRQKLFLLRKAALGLARMKRFSEASALAEEMDLFLLEPLTSSQHWCEEIEEHKDTIFQEIALHTENGENGKNGEELRSSDHAARSEQESERILCEAIENAESVFQRQTSLRELALLHARNNRIDEARKIFRNALQEAEKETNTFSRMKLLTELARCTTEAGERSASLKLYDKAVVVSESVEDIHLRGFYLKEISSAMFEDHFLREARELVEKITDYEFKTKKENGGTKSVRHENARGESDRELHGTLLHQKSLALSRAADILRKEEGYRREIETLLHDALEAAREIADPIRRSEAIRKVAEQSETSC